VSTIISIPSLYKRSVRTDLSRRSQFINPFLIACSSKNAKFATTGMSCIQRLVVSQALPKSRIKDVVEAMTECTNLGLDIQLKILQTLPSLLQNYAEQVNGNSLFTVLQICSSLQSSKTSTVSSTSAATLQQLIASLYEKLVVEDNKSLEVPTVAEVPLGDKHIPIRLVAHDTFRVFHDLCMLAEGSKPRYIRFSPTPEAALLELIESIFTGYGSVIKAHPEQAHLVKTILIPYLIKAFSEKSTFPITVRATRLLYLVVKHFIDLFPEDSETILQWFNHSLDSDATTLWRRILCVEVFREIYADSHLVLQIHAHFGGKEDKKAIIPDCLASFVRLASEKPALIGLGQQSTVPIGHYFQRDTGSESSDLSASSAQSSSAGVPTSAVPGISTQFSAVKAPCIEQLDKQEPPNAPETYIYSLVLGSLNNLSESLAKFVLPLTVATSDKSKKRQKPTVSEEDSETQAEELDAPPSQIQSAIERQKGQKKLPINPLSLKDHKSFDEIQTAAHLIDQSWPAILACCSTFFNAALDADTYRALVRSFQKFTQVAGLLEMTVPRDAFLTTLGKSAMPPNLLTAGITSAGSQPPPTPSFLSNAKGLLNVESIVNQATSFLPDRRRVSIDSGDPTLNVRNLLCLRALLNLAIALGPTLEASWSIILETLQQADRVLASAGGRVFQNPQSSSAPEGSNTQQIASEVTAVQAAASRLFESTTEFPNEAFLFVLESLCGLVDIKAPKPTADANLPSTTTPRPGQHRRITSFSGLSVKTGVNDHDYLFNLTKLRELASLNLERYVTTDNDQASGWVLLLDHLINLATSHDVTSNARLLAVDIIRQLVLDSILYPLRAGEKQELRIQSRALVPLSKLSAILRRDSSVASAPDETTIEGHIVVLETLRGLLEHTGEALVSGWPAVFEVIKSSFADSPISNNHKQTGGSDRFDLLSVKLGRTAFSSLQLICSDFLSSSLDSSISTLIDLLYNFASQEQDLNISLTVSFLVRLLTLLIL
jgi:Dimerisation and cyclophilin-binding domain of Mon2/Guanine nucleotide exchange factor in Golgi transport N-terminal